MVREADIIPKGGHSEMDSSEIGHFVRFGAKLRKLAKLRFGRKSDVWHGFVRNPECPVCRTGLSNSPTAPAPINVLRWAISHVRTVKTR